MNTGHPSSSNVRELRLEVGSRAGKVRTTHVVSVARVRFANGLVGSARFLASRVDHSGACRVSLVRDVRAEALARVMRDHFEYLGGVPDVARFEGPAAASLALRPCLRAGVRWDPSSFDGAMKGIGVEVIHKGRHQGELLAREVLATFFEGRRFADKHDLEQKLAAWCDVIVLRRFCRSGEHARLKPLGVGPDGFAVPVDVSVGAFGVVPIGGHCYVVPSAAGARATALLYPTVVRLIAGGAETLLRRKPLEA